MNTRDIQFPSNKVRDIERYCLQQLGNHYPDGEIRQMIRMLFEEFLGWNTADFLLHRDSTINQSDLLRFHWAVENLKKYRPIQHIIGHTEFCDCIIEVNEDVLIPRPETEEIVHNLPFIEGPILDLCTGSGCIAIAISKRNPLADITAVDISKKALAMAEKNNTKNNTNVKFVCADVLNPDSFPEEISNKQYHLIISNPPYVMHKEQNFMEHNVLDYEPDLALWVDDENPLVFYKAIAQFASSHLEKNGILVFEINENLSEETATLLRNFGFSPTLHQDFREKWRSITAVRES